MKTNVMTGNCSVNNDFLRHQSRTKVAICSAALGASPSRRSTPDALPRVFKMFPVFVHDSPTLPPLDSKEIPWPRPTSRIALVSLNFPGSSNVRQTMSTWMINDHDGDSTASTLISVSYVYSAPRDIVH